MFFPSSISISHVRNLFDMSQMLEKDRRERSYPWNTKSKSKIGMWLSEEGRERKLWGEEFRALGPQTCNLLERGKDSTWPRTEALFMKEDRFTLNKHPLLSNGPYSKNMALYIN